ncbi:hypothetical protein AGLY_010642 [Aphis glycines]|uniref:Uncharacterized protein n=1 Tax=Aphis glycines TaxID=307491 RepID=A0A6G0TE54_APHGL|nr:hypothetical protein AGLY_010642 [Aphis glycines]
MATQEKNCRNFQYKFRSDLFVVPSIHSRIKKGSGGYTGIFTHTFTTDGKLPLYNIYLNVLNFLQFQEALSGCFNGGGKKKWLHNKPQIVIVTRFRKNLNFKRLQKKINLVLNFQVLLVIQNFLINRIFQSKYFENLTFLSYNYIKIDFVDLTGFPSHFFENYWKIFSFDLYNCTRIFCTLPLETIPQNLKLKHCFDKLCCIDTKKTYITVKSIHSSLRVKSISYKVNDILLSFCR